MKRKKKRGEVEKEVGKRGRWKKRERRRMRNMMDYGK